jgi:hypothetical protein
VAGHHRRGVLPEPLADPAGPADDLRARLGARRRGAAAKLAVLGTVAADAALFARAYRRWAHLPRYAEFDGLVVRQWQMGNGEDGPDNYVAVDDGASAQAWAFKVGNERLTTGTIVHLRVNPRLNKLLSIEPVRHLPVAPLLAETVDPRAPGGS